MPLTWNELGKSVKKGYDWLLGIWNDITGVTANKKAVDTQNASNLQQVKETNESNYRIAQETNQANRDIASETNAMNYDVAMQNLGFQRELQEYQQALQEQIFDREDTSYQRTAKDMLAAGLNPLAMQGTNGSGEAVALSPLNNSFQAQQPNPMQAAQMQAAQFNAYQRPNQMNEFMSLVSSVIGNVEELKTGKATRDKLRQQMDIDRFDMLLRHAEKGVYINDDGKAEIDDDLYNAWLDDIRGSYEERKRQREHAERERKHQENSGKYETDTEFEKILTGVSDWLLNGRGEEAWNKLTDKFPILKIFNMYVKSLTTETKTEVTHGSSGDKWYK